LKGYRLGTKNSKICIKSRESKRYVEFFIDADSCWDRSFFDYRTKYYCSKGKKSIVPWQDRAAYKFGLSWWRFPKPFRRRRNAGFSSRTKDLWENRVRNGEIRASLFRQIASGKL
jgi:hypothetical protein